MAYRKVFYLLCLLGVIFAAQAALAVQKISVLGLFNNKAVVMIDGKRRILALNQASPEGVTLISADGSSAVLEIAGKRTAYPLGQAGANYSTPRQTAVNVYRNPQGMFTASGSINGFPVDFMVDTGATFIAMNAPQAKRLGIQYRMEGQPVTTNTASGTAMGYQVTLQRVRLGEIELRDIDAIVLEGNSPTEVLLGMSFLGRLEMQHSGQVMQLKSKN